MARPFQFGLKTIFLVMLGIAGLLAAWIYLPHIVLLCWLTCAVGILAILAEEARFNRRRKPSESPPGRSRSD